MFDAVALATWIAFCIPSADPAIATALVMAGSGGAPALIADKEGQALPARTALQADQDTYVGLTQIPAKQLRARGIPLIVALNPCVNLMLGWQLWSTAHLRAKVQQPSQWKAVSLAFSMYHDHQAVLETPFSKKATDLAIKHVPVAPARPGSRLYNEVASVWANGQAHLLRLEMSDSALGQSQALAATARVSAE